MSPCTGAVNKPCISSKGAKKPMQRASTFQAMVCHHRWNVAIRGNLANKPALVTWSVPKYLPPLPRGNCVTVRPTGVLVYDGQQLPPLDQRRQNKLLPDRMNSAFPHVGPVVQVEAKCVRLCHRDCLPREVHLPSPHVAAVARLQIVRDNITTPQCSQIGRGWRIFGRIMLFFSEQQ